MNTTSFIEKLVTNIVLDYQEVIEDLNIILPNKRAKVFLLDEIRRQLKNSVFSPNILSVEELIQDISGLHSIDNIELLFEFYEVYLSFIKDNEKQNFEQFSTWAKTAIQDFNEIDRYLLEPNKVFTYLSEAKALERWNVNVDEKTDLVDKHLIFWEQLPKYYSQLYSVLKSKKIGYQGLIYREAVYNLKEFSERQKPASNFVFAGFNALNASEEKIILHLVEHSNAKVFWDIDHYFLTNNYHDVGLFIRRYKEEWFKNSNMPFNWITNDFQQQKNIQIIGTPKSIGQAKIAGKKVEELINEGEPLDDCAVVLGDENLLLPVLNSLPNKINGLNITMGYSNKNNPAQLLILSLIKLHHNAQNRNESSYTFYYKEVISVLNHAFIEPIINVQDVVHKIRNNNLTFFNFKTLERLKETSNYNTNLNFFDLLLKPWTNRSINEVLDLLKVVLSTIKENLDIKNETEKIALTFVYSVYNLINKIESYHLKYNRIDNLESLLAVYKQLLDVSDVSFEGEPLTGLQVMGVLESRVLDFKNVIITSVNEGKFPSGKTQQSFIPYDIKRELGLPTYKEKDAIYSYHFYHLLFRAENIYLLYNTDNEGIDAGEKSRFLQQLEIEKLPNHSVKNIMYNAVLPQKSHERIEIPKSEKLLERLEEIATKKGFSPSSLTNYIRNPIQFYFQRVLRISEVDDVEESIAVNTLGTIIHDSLEVIYEPYLGKILSIENNEAMNQKIDEVVLQKFKETYKEGNITKGKNYLAYEVAKRNIFNFLNLERKEIEKGEKIKVLQTEANLSCTIKHEVLPYDVIVAGKVDRIEERDGVIRIVDYKTGKVEARNLKISTFEGITQEIKYDKIIQLLCYALMYQQEIGLPENGIEVGILSFKNLRAGFMPFVFYVNKTINKDLLRNFTEELVTLIAEILNVENNFIENTQ